MKYFNYGLKMVLLQVFLLTVLGKTCHAQVVTPPPQTPQDANIPVAPAVQTNIALPAIPVDTNTTIPVAPAVTPAPTPEVTAVPATPSPNTEVPPPSLIIETPETAKYQSAMSAYEQKRYADAAKELVEFVSNFPSSGRREEVLFRLGDCYRNLNRPGDAIATYNYQVRHYPKGPFRLNGELNRGELLYLSKQFKDAEEAFTLAMNQGEGDLKAAGTYFLARCLQDDPQVADKSNALQLLKGLSEESDGGSYSAAAALVLAQQEDLAENYSGALNHWEIALKLSKDTPSQAMAAVRGGWSSLLAGQMNVAKGLFNRSLAMDGGEELKKMATTGLLRLAFQQKDYAGWLKLYNANPTFHLDSFKEEIATDLAESKFYTKDWTGAAAAYDDYIKNFPQQPFAVTAAYRELVSKLNLPGQDAIALIQAYLKASPTSPYLDSVNLLLAQNLSAASRFSEALPAWKALAADLGKPNSPLSAAEVNLGLAQSYDGLKNWPEAAAAYQSYLDSISKENPGQTENRVRALVRLAVCWQSAGDADRATSAWHLVLVEAQAGSEEQQAALESLGWIYFKGGEKDQEAAVGVFTQLLEKFPKTSMKALAEFTLGDNFYRKGRYADAESWLRRARESDPVWMRPATQRLVLGAFGLKQVDKAEGYTQEYKTLPPPTDPSRAQKEQLPPELYLWLAGEEEKINHLTEAERNYIEVTKNAPPSATYLPLAWRLLAKIQLELKDYPNAITSFETFRKLDSTQGNNTEILLGLSQAYVGSGNYDQANELALQALRQEPEGPESAQIRMTLGDISMAKSNYAEAARQYATLAVLFDAPNITPQAIKKASKAFQMAGDSKSADEWQAKLMAKYPNFSGN